MSYGLRKIHNFSSEPNMSKHAQLVVGPAGSGKSTYCSTIYKHCETIGRTVHVINLDPAAEHFDYPVSVDIRDLISLEEVMEEMEYGPNGGLVFCIEYLLQNLDWLQEKIGDFSEDYLIFDCPGQIELYSHINLMRVLADHIQQMGFRLCAVYLIDSLFISDTSKFISGTLTCLAAMIQLELPHINVLTKCDLVPNKKMLHRFFEPDVSELIASLNDETHDSYAALNRAIGSLIEEYSMVAFVALDISKPDSVELVLAHVDTAIQWGEDKEVQIPRDLEEPDLQETDGLGE